MPGRSTASHRTPPGRRPVTPLHHRLHRAGSGFPFHSTRSHRYTGNTTPAKGRHARACACASTDRCNRCNRVTDTASLWQSGAYQVTRPCFRGVTGETQLNIPVYSIRGVSSQAGKKIRGLYPQAALSPFGEDADLLSKRSRSGSIVFQHLSSGPAWPAVGAARRRASSMQRRSGPSATLASVTHDGHGKRTAADSGGKSGGKQAGSHSGNGSILRHLTDNDSGSETRLAGVAAVGRRIGLPKGQPSSAKAAAGAYAVAIAASRGVPPVFGRRSALPV